MSNTNLVIDKITRECLRLAHEKASFLGTINRQFDKSWSSEGATGDTLRIRLPNQYTVTTGRVIDLQDSEQQKTTLTRATQKHVAFRFNSKEIATDLDFENLSKLTLDPAMSVLISNVESDVLQGCTKLVYNSAGTPGTPPVDLVAFGAARAKMNQDLAPKDGNRFIQYDSVNMGTIVNGLKGLFQDSTQIKEQYREGMMGRTAMADWYENERVYAHTTGSDHTTVTVNDGSIAEGDTGFTTAGATVTVGTVFTIANVLKVHPETKASYGIAQQFVITSVSTNDWTFSPAYYSTGPRQNVNALPVTGAAITLVGTASTAYTQNLMYHKDAFTFATAELPLMAEANKCVRRTFDGISLRVWEGADIKNDEVLTRIDILYGYAAIRPQWACRITM
jgi:hypothetical protein